MLALKVNLTILVAISLVFGVTMAARAQPNGTRAALNEAIQDEYRSQQTYLRVIATFGEVLPFVNIVEAEGRHIAAISSLYGRRGWQVPVSQWNQGNVPVYESIQEACGASAHGELQNIAIYDRLLSGELPQDVSVVFRNLREASKERHLPAFERCARR